MVTVDSKAAQSSSSSLKRARLSRAAQLGRDVTQNDMADFLGISRQYYSELERSEMVPSIRIAKKIAEVTGQTAGAVIDEYLSAQ